MDCFICGNEALLLKDECSGCWVDCSGCGIYEAQGEFVPACHTVAEGLRGILDRQRQAFIEPPIITGQSAYLLYALSLIGFNSHSHKTE
ncbi:hypothetical protein IAE37_003749 [Pseudomonas sp. S31]|uniref:hypothetical protein n=1 Tax=Pseudomonas sp. S31 TaxID=1564473 RepID=UPI001912E864|nr:hypothetical protein [Pseudomonas sp. S31]MBK5001473.1 hypothetical protein [Pseudomonas sp. S31]